MDQQAIDISVIVPVYNCEKYLEQCVLSLVNQSKKELEIILIDDGSTDQSSEICERLQNNYQRVVAVHQKNGGVAAARNTGLQYARGKYIGFVDADDYVDSKMYQIMFSDMIDNHVDLIVGSIIKIKPDGSQTTETFEFTFGSSVNLLIEYLNTDLFIACNRCLFKKQIIDNNRIAFTSQRKTGEDQEFVYRYMMHSETIFNSKQASYFYRVMENSTMFQASYLHFDNIEAMVAIDAYGKKCLPQQQYQELHLAMINNRLIHGLWFAVTTLLANGEEPSKVYRCMKQHQYDVMVTAAKVYPSKPYYKFWKLWDISPVLCLQIYYFRKKIGRTARLIKALVRG